MREDTFTPVDKTDHVLKPEGPRVTVVEYGDFECPSCGQACPAMKILLTSFALASLHRDQASQARPVAVAVALDSPNRLAELLELVPVVGILIAIGWPDNSFWLIGFYVGISMIAGGIWRIALALFTRHEADTLASDRSTAQGGARPGQA